MRKDQILIIDDTDFNREMLKAILGQEYDYLEASTGREGLQIIQENTDDLALIILDLVMPDVTGIEVLQQLKGTDIPRRIPVIIVTAENTIEIEQECFQLGAMDFIGKPFSRNIVQMRVSNALEIHHARKSLEIRVNQQSQMLRRTISKLQDQTKRLEQENENIIEILGTIVEYRNVESGNHIHRVKQYTEILGTYFIKMFPDAGLSQEELKRIVAASPLHDIGKIAIPDKILLKPGQLTPKEYEYMKSHTLRGCEILKSVEGIWDEDYEKVTYEICRYHHERYDGKGYPDGLIGDAIPISAQLVMVADVYDALVNDRCYKDAIPAEKAYHMIFSGECGVFPPRVMEVFREAKDSFERVLREGQNEEE